MVKPLTLNALKNKKAQQERFSVLTAYDATIASLCEQAGIDMILVGDSLGMVIQGYQNTVPVTMDNMIYHSQLVARGAPNTLKMVDLPFMSFSTPNQALDNATQLMQKGFAEIIKVECSDNEAHLPIIKAFNQQQIPICAHLGLTPQNILKTGSYATRGKTPSEAQRLLDNAKKFEQVGADILLLECVEAGLAKQITESVSIPVIGIGCGVHVDAQVLVIYDVLGISSYIPSFAKNFLAENDSIQQAISQYHQAVISGQFPK